MRFALLFEKPSPTQRWDNSYCSDVEQRDEGGQYRQAPFRVSKPDQTDRDDPNGGMNAKQAASKGPAHYEKIEAVDNGHDQQQSFRHIDGGRDNDRERHGDHTHVRVADQLAEHVSFCKRVGAKQT